MGPLLALVLMLDLASFWNNTWQMREHATVGYYVVLGAALVALL